MTFNTKRMPEKWRAHFKVYRSKISIYLDTADFGTPLMVDASEMMGFLPRRIDLSSFPDELGPVRPGAESLWIEAELPGPCRRARTSVGSEPWCTAARHAPA
ncbi:hypothetical protein ASG79_13710 [Arthrobacter sp. Soil761]|nr:hypothetical protein ASG79_13710 [Arthrobacter sp. Soil761]